MKNDKKMLGKVLVLLLLLFLLLFSSLFLLYKKRTSAGQKKACIYQNGVLLKEIDFSSVKEPYSFRLVSSDGGYNEITVSAGGIAVTDADCPDRLCVLFSKNNTGRLPIICLPHKLAIVYKEESASDMDAVTY
ncbi:MAG: NusG domain II-containing protein [Lachnospiraceae bacterium]|nr:NusG domain II-containing protein [Lachnospiraceae bacterium]